VQLGVYHSASYLKPCRDFKPWFGFKHLRVYMCTEQVEDPDGG